MSGLRLPEFKQSFKGHIVNPGDEEYTKAIARWAVNVERNARVVAFVKDTDDVALASVNLQETFLDLYKQQKLEKYQKCQSNLDLHHKLLLVILSKSKKVKKVRKVPKTRLILCLYQHGQC